MTIKNKLKAIIEGSRNTLTRGDVVKIVNYVKAQNKEIKRLGKLKNTEIEITIVDI